MVDQDLLSYRNLFLLIFVLPSVLVSSPIDGIIFENNDSESSFEIIQIPSGFQIPVGTNLSLEFKPTRPLFNDIDGVLLFYCIMNNETSSCTNPVQMTKDNINLLFRCSILLENQYTDVHLRYRFIAYYSNGTPQCLPYKKDHYNQNIVQGRSGLFYFSIEIVNRKYSMEMNTLILSLATFSTFSILLFLIKYSKPYKKGHRI